MNPAKAAEQIEVPFGMWTRVAQGLGGLKSPREGVILVVILGRAQTCLRSIFSTVFTSGRGDAASGWQSTVVTCYLHSALHPSEAA